MERNETKPTWRAAYDRMQRDLIRLGFPAELGDAIAKTLGSPQAMTRMAAYLEQARPKSIETVADEMLAIQADADAWRRKKAAQEANARYNRYLWERRETESEDS